MWQALASAAAGGAQWRGGRSPPQLGKKETAAQRKRRSAQEEYPDGEHPAGRSSKRAKRVGAVGESEEDEQEEEWLEGAESEEGQQGVQEQQEQEPAQEQEPEQELEQEMEEPGSEEDDGCCFVCGEPEAEFDSTADAAPSAPEVAVCGKRCEAKYLWRTATCTEPAQAGAGAAWVGPPRDGSTSPARSCLIA